MRMMLRFTAPVERSNQAIKDGSLKKTLESLMAKLKPEAAYFGPLEGKRAAMIFFDMASIQNRRNLRGAILELGRGGRVHPRHECG